MMLRGLMRPAKPLVPFQLLSAFRSQLAATPLASTGQQGKPYHKRLSRVLLFVSPLLLELVAL